MSSTPIIKISKPGTDLSSALDKDLVYTSKFDTFKIRKTGTLTLNLPSETFGAWSPGGFTTYTQHETSYTHNIGDICFFLPRALGEVAYVGTDVINGGNYVVNDLEEDDISRFLPDYFYGISTIETVQLVISNSKLTLKVVRENYLVEDVTFGARTATVNYTIFYNRADEEFNLLT